jgi:hypothetical protein
MSTKLNANLNAVELTQAELDCVSGGHGDRYPRHRHRKPSQFQIKFTILKAREAASRKFKL